MSAQQLTAHMRRAERELEKQLEEEGLSNSSVRGLSNTAAADDAAVDACADDDAAVDACADVCYCC